MKDYYGILGVAENASDDDIKKAYRKLASQIVPLPYWAASTGKAQEVHTKGALYFVSRSSTDCTSLKKSATYSVISVAAANVVTLA